jgi:hypothetical protein
MNIMMGKDYEWMDGWMDGWVYGCDRWNDG